MNDLDRAAQALVQQFGVSNLSFKRAGKPPRGQTWTHGDPTPAAYAVARVVLDAMKETE